MHRTDELEALRLDQLQSLLGQPEVRAVILDPERPISPQLQEALLRAGILYARSSGKGAGALVVWFPTQRCREYRQQLRGNPNAALEAR